MGMCGWVLKPNKKNEQAIKHRNGIGNAQNIANRNGNLIFCCIKTDSSNVIRTNGPNVIFDINTTTPSERIELLICSWMGRYKWTRDSYKTKEKIRKLFDAEIRFSFFTRNHDFNPINLCSLVIILLFIYLLRNYVKFCFVQIYQYWYLDTSSFNFDEFFK